MTTSAAGVISACSNMTSGQLRVLAAGAACDTKKETPISWKIQGIQGIQGEKGDTGAAASTSVTARLTHQTTLTSLAEVALPARSLLVADTRWKENPSPARCFKTGQTQTITDGWCSNPRPVRSISTSSALSSSPRRRAAAAPLRASATARSPISPAALRGEHNNNNPVLRHKTGPADQVGDAKEVRVPR